MKRLWNNSLVAKVFLSYFSVVALLFAGFYFYSNNHVREFHIATLSARMDQEAHLLGRGSVKTFLWHKHRDMRLLIPKVLKALPCRNHLDLQIWHIRH